MKEIELKKIADSIVKADELIMESINLVDHISLTPKEIDGFDRLIGELIVNTKCLKMHIREKYSLKYCKSGFRCR